MLQFEYRKCELARDDGSPRHEMGRVRMHFGLATEKEVNAIPVGVRPEERMAAAEQIAGQVEVIGAVVPILIVHFLFTIGKKKKPRTTETDIQSALVARGFASRGVRESGPATTKAGPHSRLAYQQRYSGSQERFLAACCSAVLRAQSKMDIRSSISQPRRSSAEPMQS